MGKTLYQSLGKLSVVEVPVYQRLGDFAIHGQPYFELTVLW